ncbi:MAG: S41 family peptidase [Acidobacteriota bacterium]
MLSARRTWVRALTIGLAGPALLSAASAVPAAPETAPSLDAARARQVAEAVATAIDDLYVDPEAGRRIAAELRTRSAAGAYDRAASASTLGDRLTRDLQEIGRDRHLSVRRDASGMPGGRSRRTVIDGPPPEGAPPGGPGPIRVIRGSAPPDPARAEAARRTNFGLRAAERMDGNVGYLDVREFQPLPLSRDTLAAAMAFLAGSDAIVVDLRDCPGGAPGSVSFLASYFFGPERRELFRRYDRPSGETTTEYTEEDLPGRRLPSTDLWILVSPRTASAGESFAYLLQQFGRATVVGERTAGAGHNAALLPVGEDLVLSVSVGRPIHPKTGKGWEGEGVRPDVASVSASALSVAHAAALKKLLSGATDEKRRREIAWALERVEASSRPDPAVETLRAYAGRYGEREVAIEGSRLVCRTPTGRTRTLVPVGKDAFSWDEQTRATFGRDAGGRLTELVLDRIDGTLERFPREAPSENAAKEPR